MTQIEEDNKKEEAQKIQLTKKGGIMPNVGIGGHQPQKDSTRKQGRNHSPHACSTREYTPSQAQSIGASPPSLGLGNRPNQEFSKLCSWC
jgi:hypothetical protein